MLRVTSHSHHQSMVIRLLMMTAQFNYLICLHEDTHAIKVMAARSVKVNCLPYYHYIIELEIMLF